MGRTIKVSNYYTLYLKKKGKRGGIKFKEKGERRKANKKTCKFLVGLNGVFY